MDRNARPLNEVIVNLLPTPQAHDAQTPKTPKTPKQIAAMRARGHGVSNLNEKAPELATDWGIYAPAVARWERTLGRPAPEPTEAGTRGNRRLSPALPEWMLGLPAGHVTAVPGLSRAAQLRAIGDGVCPQQAALAARILLALAGGAA